jgi:hypothetical protein
MLDRQLCVSCQSTVSPDISHCKKRNESAMSGRVKSEEKRRTYHHHSGDALLVCELALEAHARGIVVGDDNLARDVVEVGLKGREKEISSSSSQRKKNVASGDSPSTSSYPKRACSRSPQQSQLPP